MAGPREPATTPALAELPESDSAAIESESDSVIVGEIDTDEIDDDPYLPAGFQPQRESAENDADVIDVEIVDAGYTDAAMSDDPGMITPDESDSSLSGAHSGSHRPGSGLLSLEAANAEAAHIRNMRRRKMARFCSRRLPAAW